MKYKEADKSFLKKNQNILKPVQFENLFFENKKGGSGSSHNASKSTSDTISNKIFREL